jgi:probable O-glycosylation ligase (exosortase A-associated)
MNKQLIFMAVMTLAGTAGVYIVSPFWGVLVYYLFAVLRPQFMWEWSLPQDVSWSFYVAVSTIGAVVLGLHRTDRLALGAAAPPFRLTPAHKWVAAFAAWVVLTSLTAISTDVSYYWMTEYAKIFVMFAVGTVLVCTARRVWALYLTAAAALAYIAYEVNYLYFVNHYLGIQRNGYGGLDNNGAGLMLATGVPLCWFAFEGLRHPSRWLFAALIPVQIHAVLMTYSRGAMLSLIVMVPVLILRSRRRALLSFVLIGLGLIGIPAMAGKEIKARFMTIEQHEADASANSRKNAWRAAYLMACERPVLGVGTRNANLFSYKYGADFEGRTIHSQYFQILADNGFPGVTLYVAMVVASWWSVCKARRAIRGREDPEARIVRASASGLECALVLFSFGAAFLSLEVCELPYLLMLLCAQLGGMYRPSSQGRRGDEPLAAGHAAGVPAHAEGALLAPSYR